MSEKNGFCTHTVPVGMNACEDCMSGRGDAVEPLSLFDEVGEAVRELRAFEGKIRTPLVVHYSNGTVKPLGELLCRVGAYLRAQETPKTRVLGANGLPLLLTKAGAGLGRG